jgi:hypothetical protein
MHRILQQPCRLARVTERSRLHVHLTVTSAHGNWTRCFSSSMRVCANVKNVNMEDYPPGLIRCVAITDFALHGH